MEFEIEGKTQQPQPEEFLIPAQARHSDLNIGPSTARWLYDYKKGK